MLPFLLDSRKVATYYLKMYRSQLCVLNPLLNMQINIISTFHCSSSIAPIRFYVCGTDYIFDMLSRGIDNRVLAEAKRFFSTIT
jgi:hypothetical protein